MQSKRLRPTVDVYFLEIAKVVASRGTCARRTVGCVLVDAGNRILATGYNGVASGQPHCIELACPGAALPSGQGLDKCQAIHAEVNALVHCSDIKAVVTAYITTTPCISCVKNLLSSNCQRIVASSQYASAHDDARKMWEAAGRKWEVIESNQRVGEPVPGMRRKVAKFFPG